MKYLITCYGVGGFCLSMAIFYDAQSTPLYPPPPSALPFQTLANFRVVWPKSMPQNWVCVRGIYAKVFGVCLETRMLWQLVFWQWPEKERGKGGRERETACVAIWTIKMMANYQMAEHTFAQLPQLARFAHWFDPTVVREQTELELSMGAPTLSTPFPLWVIKILFGHWPFFCVIINYVISRKWPATFGSSMWFPESISSVFRSHRRALWGGFSLDYLNPHPPQLWTCLRVPLLVWRSHY